MSEKAPARAGRIGRLTRQLIESVCPPSLRHEVSEFLTWHCSNSLPGVGSTSEWDELIDRVQLAAIRGSSWNMHKIKKAVALAKIDWRDVLVSAGFGNSLSEHENWQQQAIKSGDIS